MSRSLASRFSGLSDPVKAALLVVFAGLLFSVMNVLIRHASSELHPLEIVFFRNLFGFVAMLPWLLHRREDQWPDTHEFHPERFSSPEQQDTIRNYYYPFSAGERVCIGAGFASQEAILILARVVRDFQLSPVPGCEPQPVGHITIKPDQNIQLRLAARDE